MSKTLQRRDGAEWSLSSSMATSGNSRTGNVAPRRGNCLQGFEPSTCTSTGLKCLQQLSNGTCLNLNSLVTKDIKISTCIISFGMTLSNSLNEKSLQVQDFELN